MVIETLERITRTPRTARRGRDSDRKIDPRIRERRLRIRRDVNRRRLWKLGVLVGLVALVAAAVAALRSPLLDVDRVVVVGARHTGSETVVAASGVRHRVPLGSVPLAATSRRVADLPWVDRATVRRVWPGTVRISVTERRPVAQIRAPAEGWLLVDRSGRLLDRETALRTDLVTVSGQPPVGPGTWLAVRWLDRLRVAAALPADVTPQVMTVLADGSGVSLQLRSGASVVLGRPSDLVAKLEALRTLLAQPDQACFAAINLGVASAPALTRRPNCG